MRRPLLLGIMVCAVVVVMQAPAPSPPASASPTSVERVEYRSPVPSCAEGIKQLGLEGQPVDCEEPPPLTYDPPQMHGKFRLVPESYVGPLSYEDMPDTAPQGVVSDEIQGVKTSSIYAEPAWLPKGYSLSSASTGGTDSEHMIVAAYTGPGEPIYITRRRQFTWPISLILPVGDSSAVFETPVLEGKEAVLYYPKPGFSGQTVLSFVDGDVETTVFGEPLDPGTATRIALSLICGTSCVDSPAAAGGAYSEGTSGAAAEPQGAAEASSVATGNASTMSGTMYNNQVRVMAGLGTPDQNVKTLASGWHGFDYAPGSQEAALDLQDPRGAAQTIGEDVWVTTWPWSGAGQIRFTAQEYQLITLCTGRYVELRDTGAHYLGKLTYVHLDPDNEAPLNETWLSNQNLYWTIHWVGKVAASQPGCAWTTVHLHQGQRVYDGTQMTYNAALGTHYMTFAETDYVNKWMHSLPFAGSGDWDGDGCTDSKEAAMGFDAYNYWDFFDVPTPALADPAPNGPRDRQVDMRDVLAVLFYVFADDNSIPNSNGVDYDSTKDGDWNDDTVVTQAGDQVGLRYDRTPSSAPNPPWDAGSPNGFIDLSDVLIVLAQAFKVDCSGSGLDGGRSAGGGTSTPSDGSGLDFTPNAMALDAVPGGAINSYRLVTTRDPFDVQVVVGAAGEPYAGFQASLSYDDQVLEFLPTEDLNSDTVAESWSYTGLGGININAMVVQSDLDGDTAVDEASGGAARSSGATSETGAVITARFRCLRTGYLYLHLMTPSESTSPSTTLGSGGGTIDTGLADAWITCWVN